MKWSRLVGLAVPQIGHGTAFVGAHRSNCELPLATACSGKLFFTTALFRNYRSALFNLGFKPKYFSKEG